MRPIFTIKGIEQLDSSLLKKSAINSLVAQTWHAVGRHWHVAIRKKHFEVSAYQVYGYTRRSNKYTKAKAKKYNHVRPLVYSGETRANTATANIESTRNKVTVTYPGAANFNRRSKGQTFRMQDEFTKLIPRDLAELEKVAEQKLTSLVNAAIARLK